MTVNGFGLPTMPNLGPCCVCGRHKDVANIVCLDRRGPVPGKGWGCTQCDLPSDGAVAVMCNACMGMMPIFVCNGYPHEGRVRADSLADEWFGHNREKHPELEGTI